MSDLQKSFNVIAADFPSIGAKIKLFWGHQEFTDLTHELLNSTRDHSRVGFPLAVTAALFDLQDRHDRLFPQLAEPRSNARILSHRPVPFDQR